MEHANKYNKKNMCWLVSWEAGFPRHQAAHQVLKTTGNNIRFWRS